MATASHILEWVSQLGAEPSLLGWGLREGDRAATSFTNSPELSTAQLDETWHRLADVATNLATHCVPAQRLCWKYEHAVLHFITRHDGLSLGLVTLAGSGATTPAVVDSVAAEFLALG